MNIQLHPEVVEILKKQTADVESLINGVLLTYLKGGFISRSEVDKSFHVKKIYRKQCSEIADCFDEITHEFCGTAIVGKSESQSLWISSVELHDSLVDNELILVMKSPRKEGISIKKGEDHHIEIGQEDLS